MRLAEARYEVRLVDRTRTLVGRNGACYHLANAETDARALARRGWGYVAGTNEDPEPRLIDCACAYVWDRQDERIVFTATHEGGRQ